MLLIDTEKEPAQATIYSDPVEGGYRTSTTVRLGEKLHIPAPLDHDFDTALLLDE